MSGRLALILHFSLCPSRVPVLPWYTVSRLYFSASWLGHVLAQGMRSKWHCASPKPRIQEALCVSTCSCNSANARRMRCLGLPTGPKRRMGGTCNRALLKPRPDKPTLSWSADLGNIINHTCSKPLHVGMICYAVLTNWYIMKSVSGRFGLRH